MGENTHNGRKYSQIMSLIRDLYLGYTHKILQFNTKNKQTGLKLGKGYKQTFQKADIQITK